MITVLTAAYNGKKYIREQMDSILAQSQDGILLVVSDDGSSDGTRELLQAYEEEHRENVLVLMRRRPSGGAAAHFLELLKLMGDLRAEEEEKEGRMTPKAGEREPEKEQQSPESGAWELDAVLLAGLRRAASADFFMLSDQDDVWLPDKASVLLHKAEELEAGSSAETPVLVHSDLSVVDENLTVIASSFFRYQGINPGRIRLSQLLVQNNITGGAVMLNAAMLPYLRHIPGVCLMHDAWLGLVASAFGSIGWAEEPLYLYRQHGSNAVGARRGSEAQDVRRRLEDGSRARENYRRMFGQAASMLELFPEQLSEEQKKMLAVFAGMEGHGRLMKIWLILRWGFTKDTWLRTLGQMLMI